MKYAVIADIHGNFPALQLAMKDALEQGSDQFVFLGDYCVSAAWPNEVIDELRTKDGAVSICGNEENYLKLPDGEDGQFAISRWAGRQLSDVNRKWLDGLPEEMELTAEGVQIHAAHKSEAFIGKSEIMHFSMDRMAERQSGCELIGRQDLLNEVREALAADESFSERIRQIEPGVYLFGHTQP